MRHTRRGRLSIGVIAAACLLSGAAGLGADTNAWRFSVGERLDYKMYWGRLRVGTAWFDSQWIRCGERRLLRITANARSTSVLSWIYPVEDTVESIVDPVTFLPLQYTQRLREGRKRRQDLMVFDHEAGRAVWTDENTGEKKSFAIKRDSRDILCFSYFMRGVGYDVGQTNTFQVLVDDKMYDLTIEGLRRETIKSEVEGISECLVLEPKAKFGEIFVRKGRIWLWFSEDDTRAIANVKAELKVASLRAVLYGITMADPTNALPEVTLATNLLSEAAE